MLEEAREKNMVIGKVFGNKVRGLTPTMIDRSVGRKRTQEKTIIAIQRLNFRG